MSEISVLVPSYNHSLFIERTLRSIFRQTLQPKKLLVIDDGSKDNSVKIIENVLRDCPFENEFIARENRGLCATLNEGFGKTKEEFFAYIGSDDVWLPTFLEEQTELLKNRPNAVLAFGHAYLIDEYERIIDRTDNWTSFADGDVLPFLLKRQIFSSPSVVYRRKFVEKFGWNEDARLEDYELYLKLSSEGEFARNEKILCGWRQHGSNTSGNAPEMLSELIAAQDRVIDKLRISREELDKIQLEMKFNSTVDFIRQGYKREAISLFWNNLGGAKSLTHIGKMLVCLLIPQSLFQWNKRRKMRSAIHKYGELKL